MRRVGIWAAVTILAAIACRPSVAPEPERFDGITQEEIAAHSTINSALDAVQQLRPSFIKLRDRRSGVIVYVERARMGGLDQLAHIPAAGVSTIRYLSQTDAVLIFGRYCWCPSGVIEVRLLP